MKWDDRLDINYLITYEMLYFHFCIFSKKKCSVMHNIQKRLLYKLLLYVCVFSNLNKINRTRNYILFTFKQGFKALFNFF